MLKSRTSKTKTFVGYLCILLILFLFLYPLSFVLATSLKTQVAFLQNSITFSFVPTFENYINAWNKASLGKYIFNSILYTTVGTFL